MCPRIVILILFTRELETFDLIPIKIVSPDCGQNSQFFVMFALLKTEKRPFNVIGVLLRMVFFNISQ